MSDAALEVKVLDDLGHINLRGNPGDAAFLAATESVLGHALPLTPNTFVSGKPDIFVSGSQRTYWLGPDEWLLVSSADSVNELLPGLRDALQGRHASINDLSGGQIALRLAGAEVRKLLAKGCTLDLHPGEFGKGDCAQSALAKANVLIACADGQQAFDVFVRRSFSGYLLQWLRSAGFEYGIEFT